MSRSIKDLRELICVSRLSIRDDRGEDDDYDDSDQMFSSSLNGHSTKSYMNQRDVGSKSCVPGNNASENSNDRRIELVVGRPKSAVGGVRRPISAAQKGIQSQNGSVSSKERTHAVRTSEDHFSDESRKYVIVNDDKRIEMVLHYVDANVISDWLERCNHDLDIIVEWLKKGQNFIHFAFFLLSQFHSSKRKELIDMEVSFILSEFELAFKVGIRDKKLKMKDVRMLLQVVLNEYPTRLHGTKGSYLFLKMLLTFSCGKNDTFKHLLADVKLTTCKTQYIQWLLAMRAFCLVSLTNGIINFYKQLVNLETDGSNRASEEKICHGEDIRLIWLTDAIELNDMDVFKCLCEFYMETYEDWLRSKRKFIISKVITTGCEQILRYLADEIFVEVNWNEPFETGNTALHVAVNNGQIEIVKALLHKGADVNLKNIYTDNATALHMAVVNGHEDLLALLINNGADTSLKMGPPPGVTAKHLASDLGNIHLLKYFPD